MYRFILYALLVLGLLNSPSLFAQEWAASPTQWQGGVGLILGVPQGAFQRNITDPGIGIGGHIGYRVPQSPLMIGLRIDYLIYGYERRAAPFSTTIPDVTVDVNTNNNILQTNIFMRIQPRNGVFRPYIEGLAGMNYLFTHTSIHDQSSIFNDNDAIASTVNFDDAALTYGFGAGFNLRVYDGREKLAITQRGVGAVSLDFSLRYLNGTEASYLREGSIKRQNGQVTYSAFRSRTNLVTGMIGVSVDF
jgi:hypothetical protein